MFSKIKNRGLHVLDFVSPVEGKDRDFNLFHHPGTPKGGIIASGEISENVPTENIKAIYESYTEIKW